MNTPQSPDDTSPLPSVDAFVGQVVLRLKHLRDPEQRGDLTDAAASEALTLASMLFNALAGWARDHVIGRAINGISAAPYQSGTVRERNLGDDRPWDNPKLEQVGASYEFNDSRANKKLIIELLDPMDRALGTRLSSELIQAFEGLLFGQQSALVKPEPTRMKGRARDLWWLRFRAVSYAQFLHGTGLTKGDAQDRVADDYGLNTSPSVPGRETLTKWEQRIREHFDSNLVTDMLETSFNQGTWYKHYLELGNLDPYDQDHSAYLSDHFGTAAMERNGRDYARLYASSRKKILGK